MLHNASAIYRSNIFFKMKLILYSYLAAICHLRFFKSDIMLAKPKPEETMADTLDSKKINLKTSFFSFRTLLGLAIASLIIYLFLRNFNLQLALQALSSVNIFYLMAAFVIFYISLPLRGLRWQYMMKPTGQQIDTAKLSHYFFLSWFANAILPARIGDIYRAYLLKKNHDISISQSLGVIFSERIFDLAVTGILVILSASVFWSVLKGGQEVNYLGWGIIIIAIFIFAFLILIKFMPRFMGRLPITWQEKAARFQSGLFKSPGLIPSVGLMTIAIWLCEATRLYFVFWAFNVHAGFMVALFISQASLLLMSLPLSPAGLGLVELLMLKLLTSINLTAELAGAITIADRLISYWSLILLGGIVYLLSPRER